MIRRPLLALLVAATLAGCGAPVTGLARANAAKGVAAKAEMDDVIELVKNATERAAENAGFSGGIAAVMDAPTDVFAQKGLNTWFGLVADHVEAGMPMELDERMGKLSIAQAEQSAPPVANAQVQAYVQQVADRLTEARGLSRFETHVIMEPGVNAFNAGGHSLVVFVGLLAEAKDEAELAGVLGHEMTHGMERHSLTSVAGHFSDKIAVAQVDASLDVTPEELGVVEGHMRILEGQRANMADRDYVLSYLKGKVDADTMRALVFRYNSYFATMNARRLREHQADVGAMRMMAAAGYDPTALVRTMDRWNDSWTGDTRYLSHPTPGDRVGLARAVIAQEGLKGDDVGADRLAAIQKLLKAPTGAESVKTRQPLLSLGNNPWLRPRTK